MSAPEDTVDYKFVSYDNDENKLKQSTSASIEQMFSNKENASAVSSEENARSIGGIQIGSSLRPWADISRLNYYSSHACSVVRLVSSQAMRKRTIGLPPTTSNLMELDNKELEMLWLQFPEHKTSLMNDQNYWGCFYILPELYADQQSPTVRMRYETDIPPLENGVLTGDMVTVHLKYLKQTPILGDYVYIKLDLSNKFISNIDVLQRFKYLVYLDLSSNVLTEIRVLAFLLYLQYLAVSYNQLSTVLEYDTPQWFLTEVYYKYNSVKKIRDLSLFWSITILDLSHNNIKVIRGLENLRFLRRLDLSFNHIQKFENLDNLRLSWLDLSYNNISSFEFGPNVGLRTLTHLEYLNLNENNLTSMKIFNGCVRFQELHIRNNRLSSILELAVYMQELRKLVTLDMRVNPVCNVPGYKDVIISTFPCLLNLDAEDLDPIEQRSFKMDSNPDVETFATRRLLRLLYIEQLSRATVSPYVPPADTTAIPLIILVGEEAVGKGTLARRLARDCSDHIELGYLHTTATHHYENHYKEISRSKFDDMLLNGQFLTYDENHGESYGLSRQEAFVRDDKVKVICMNLVGALMLKLRGLRPYLILVTCLDKKSLYKRQYLRRYIKNLESEKRKTMTKTPMDISTLQVFLSGRIIITGILNEILLNLPEEKDRSMFTMDSSCSLFNKEAVHDEESRKERVRISLDPRTSVGNSSETGESSSKSSSLFSLYRKSQNTDEYFSVGTGLQSIQDRESVCITAKSRNSNVTNRKSIEPSKTVNYPVESTKSIKSVTFVPQDTAEPPPPIKLQEKTSLISNEIRTQNLLTVPETDNMPKSISARFPEPEHDSKQHSMTSLDDLWLKFLVETGLLQGSSAKLDSLSAMDMQKFSSLSPGESIVKQLNIARLMGKPEFPTEVDVPRSGVNDDYEYIHLKNPGLFWDTITTDKPNEAFLKAKSIIKEIVNSQSTFKPMFNIDFASLTDYPIIEKRLKSIQKEIAPRTLFY